MKPGSYVFTSESVSPGHPDKICDQISDALLDHCLREDPNTRCAFEAFATINKVIIGGELRHAKDILTPQKAEEIIRSLLKSINCTSPGFHYDTVPIENLIHEQSTDIAIGVDSNSTAGRSQGAGDQGLMFGYACNETDDYMPAEIHYAHKILETLWHKKPKGLLSDAKSQVTLCHTEEGQPIRAQSITVSVHHEEHLSSQDIRQVIMPILQEVFPEGWLPDEGQIFINPTGKFTIGGPVSDTGLTGRKVIVDTYGGSAPHGGGAFSGKDPSKVDRSAAYMARYIAKDIVRQGIAKRCTIQIAYVIGIANPVSIYVNTHSSNKLLDAEIAQQISQCIGLQPAEITSKLKLNKPIHLPTATFGHFGRKYIESSGHFTWEAPASLQLTL